MAARLVTKKLNFSVVPPPVDAVVLPPPVDAVVLPPPVDAVVLPPPVDAVVLPPPVDAVVLPPPAVAEPPELDDAPVAPSLEDSVSEAEQPSAGESSARVRGSKER
ncbi:MULTISPECIES: hypothetical protein [Sorangium]|uniref:hypothetical protein n=1 Tax=Sorangium TaxID=39643 RepID=UPI00101A2D09|nr:MULTISPECIES: hypothetical protein [Sorangium]